MYRGKTAKKISDAAQRSAASVSVEETERQEDPFNIGDANTGDDALIRANFGEPLLFVLYKFYDKFKHKPENWDEVFDFTRMCKVENLQREIALSMSKIPLPSSDGLSG